MRRQTETARVLAMSVGLLAIASTVKAETSTTETIKTVKELAIMSRILERQIGAQLPGEVLTSSMFQRGIQGFYAPGVGALFSINVKFAVAEPPQKPQEQDEDDPDDLWRRFEREMSGEPSVSLLRKDGRIIKRLGGKGTIVAVLSGGRFDKTKVERLKSSIFDVLARYGQKIETVAADERIIILVNGRSSSGPTTFFQYRNPGGKPSASALEPLVAPSLPVSSNLAKPGIKVPISNSVSAPGSFDVRMVDVLAEPQHPVTPRAVAPQAAADPELAVAAYSDALQKVNRLVASTSFMRVEGASVARSVMVIVIKRGDLVDDAGDLAKKASVRAYTE